MDLLIGSDHGVFRATDDPFAADDLEQVLDSGKVTSIRAFDHTDAVYVTAESGAYRTTDDGDTWTDLDVPLGERFWYAGESAVWSLVETMDGALYAGTNDPYLYRSVDDGETWREVRGFRELPTRGIWESPVDPHYARVRGLDTVPGRPEILVAGIEAGGVHVSYDAGRTWNDLRDESPTDDIHQVHVMDEDCWLVAAGHLDLDLEHLGVEHAAGAGGIWRTTDAGHSWTRLDAGNEYSYARRLYVNDGVLYFCGATRAPPEWADAEHEAALFESTDFGRTFERVDYPSEPEVIEAWATDGDRVVCGSGYYNVANYEYDEGTVMERVAPGEYAELGKVPGSVAALHAL